MSGHRFLLGCLFVASCSLFADPLPVLDATFANASWGMSGQISFTLGGPAFDMGGTALWVPPPIFVTPGESAHSALAGVPFFLGEVIGHHLIPSGTLTLDGVTYGVEYDGIAGVMYPDFTIPTTPFPTVVVPATMVGTYTACAILVPSQSNACEHPGDQDIATINVNVPGELTLPFGGPFSNGQYILDVVTFVSTPVPEPSSMPYALLTLGLAASAIVSRRRSSGKR